MIMMLHTVEPVEPPNSETAWWIVHISAHRPELLLSLSKGPGRPRFLAMAGDATVDETAAEVKAGRPQDWGENGRNRGFQFLFLLFVCPFLDFVATNWFLP